MLDEITTWLASIELSQLETLHFIRPNLLLLLLAIPVLAWLMSRSQQSTSSWGKFIAPQMLRVLQGEEAPARKTSTRLNLFTLSIALGLFVVGAAGPSWQQKSQPVAQISDHLVVVLDLSLSMLSEDSPPSRLVRTKQKIVDLLEARKEGSTALIAFSGDAFVVTPLTDDTKTIQANLAALEPLIMPVIGSRPDIAVEQALALLQQGGLDTGRIAMFTDGVTDKQASTIEATLANSSVTLNVIGVGTAQGGPIKLPENRGYLKDQGTVVIPKTDFSSLRDIANKNKGYYANLSLNDSDITPLLTPATSLSAESENERLDNSLEFDQWEDMGYLFFALAIPFALFAYQRGTLLCIALLLPLTPERSYAFSFDDLWLTKDQQAQRAVEAQDYEAASKLFDSTQHKAEALYRSGEYEAAAELYQSQNDANALFNQGNSLAHAQDFDGAIAAYDKALAQRPDFKEAIENKALIEQLREQSQQQSQDGESSNENDSDQSQSDQSNSEQSNSDQQDDNQSQESGQDSGQESNQDNRQQQNSDSNSQSSSQEQESQQSENQNNAQSGEQDEQDQSSSTSDAEQLKEEQEQNARNGAAENADDEQRQQNQQQASNAIDQAALDELNAQDNQDLNDGSLYVEGRLSDEERRSFEQWMRRVPDDPSGLLRRKFEQQSRQRNRPSNPEEPLW